MKEKIDKLKDWLLDLDYESINLPAPADKAIVLGTVDLTRYEQNLVISIIPETEEESEKYNYIDGAGIELTVTLTILCRGSNQNKLIENMDKYQQLICDAIRTDCTLDDNFEGSALGQRKFYFDAGTVEKQMSACELSLTLLYERNY